jgi:hypothetical protein
VLTVSTHTVTANSSPILASVPGAFPSKSIILASYHDIRYPAGDVAHHRQRLPWKRLPVLCAKGLMTTTAQVQSLFDAADDQMEQARTLRRKGVLAAMRDDAAALKTAYASGLHRREICGLDVPAAQPRTRRTREVSVRRALGQVLFG